MPMLARLVKKSLLDPVADGRGALQLPCAFVLPANAAASDISKSLGKTRPILGYAYS